MVWKPNHYPRQYYPWRRVGANINTHSFIRSEYKNILIKSNLYIISSTVGVVAVKLFLLSNMTPSNSDSLVGIHFPLMILCQVLSYFRLAGPNIVVNKGNSNSWSVVLELAFVNLMTTVSVSYLLIGLQNFWYFSWKKISWSFTCLV